MKSNRSFSVILLILVFATLSFFFIMYKNSSQEPNIIEHQDSALERMKAKIAFDKAKWDYNSKIMADEEQKEREKKEKEDRDGDKIN